MVFDFIFGSISFVDLLRKKALRSFCSQGLILWAAADVTIELKRFKGFKVEWTGLLMNSWRSAYPNLTYAGYSARELIRYMSSGFPNFPFHSKEDTQPPVPSPWNWHIGPS